MNNIQTLIHAIKAAIFIADTLKNAGVTMHPRITDNLMDALALSIASQRKSQGDADLSLKETPEHKIEDLRHG